MGTSSRSEGGLSVSGLTEQIISSALNIKRLHMWPRVGWWFFSLCFLLVLFLVKKKNAAW